MKFLNLSWTIKKSDKKIGDRIKTFDWYLIEQKLIEILGSAGTLTIYAEDENESPIMLQLRTENGAFLVTLGMETSDGWVVKTYNNSNNGIEKVEILGDLWDKKSICYDKNLIVEIFKCFYVEGCIDKNLLN